MQVEQRSRSEARRLDVQRASARELPIIMSAPMVCATLADRKAETRRVVRFRGDALEHLDEVVFVRMQDYPDGSLRAVFELGGEPFSVRSPYGGPGDRLWVRETWARHEPHPVSSDTTSGPEVAYADMSETLRAFWSRRVIHRATATRDETGAVERWRPAIYLPRWGARIVLDVVDVRVERLQAITAEGAKAEGLATVTKDGSLWKWGIPDRDGYPGTDDHGWPWTDWSVDPIAAFRRGWDQINGARGHTWESNPWVWVVSFRRVEELVR